MLCAREWLIFIKLSNWSMEQFNISVRLFLIISLVALGSCAQNNRQEETLSTLYAGSTPCDPFIRAQLGIPAEIKCDFIKWELNLDPAGSDSFKISATYGESKPNTNGFIKAEHFLAKGHYAFTEATIENSKYSVLNLYASPLKSPLILITMDSNILHFADDHKRFLVGNGGWGYVLNRLNLP
jgi:hypothetical protein